MIINSTLIRPPADISFSEEKKKDSGFSKSTELTESEEKRVKELKINRSNNL